MRLINSYLTRIVMALCCMLGAVSTAIAVDGVIEINQAKALAGNVTSGDAAGYPIYIKTSGSFRLTGNLTHSAPIAAIIVEAANVTIDLNGFTISGSGSGTYDGILTWPTAINLEIRNGTVRNFGRYGINTQSYAPNARIINVRTTENGSDGIHLEGKGALIQNCSSNVNGRYGIYSLGGATIIGNNIRGNTSHGLSMSTGDGYGMNVLTENNGGNANAQTTGFNVQIGTNICGINTTCP